MTVNKVILVGNLGADPESRQSKAGNTITNLRIATSERTKDRDGNWGDHTEWHRVVCFGRTAETAARFLSKGRQVYIEGKVRTRKWQDRDGNDKYTTEVVADQVRFLGGGEGRGQQSQQSPPSNPSRRATRTSYDSSHSAYGAPLELGLGEDDDIPF